MGLLKCYACDGVFEEDTLIYTKDPDELMCPLCGSLEPGFEEVGANIMSGNNNTCIGYIQNYKEV